MDSTAIHAIFTPYAHLLIHMLATHRAIMMDAPNAG